MTIERFEDIEGWKLGRQICQKLGDLVQTGTLGKDFSLKDQMSRSSGSILDNIAEGFDGGSNAEFVRFMQHSKRSCSEVQSQLYRCLDRQHMTREQFEGLYELVRLTRSKIGAFINYLERNQPARKRHPGKPRTEN
jgi:four helix bundle protein